MATTDEDINAKRKHLAELRIKIEDERAKRDQIAVQAALESEAVTLDLEAVRLEQELAYERAITANQHEVRKEVAADARSAARQADKVAVDPVVTVPQDTAAAKSAADKNKEN